MVTSHVVTSRLRVWFGLACIALGVLEFTPRTALLANVPGPILNIRLTPSQTLSDVSRRALIREAAAIWRSGSVQLRWLEGNRDSESAALRVLVTPQAVSQRVDEGNWTIGELLRFEGETAIAVASIDGARRMVDIAQRSRPLDPPTERDYLVGVVLGRAIAHEIGHYLLQTNTHAPSGLMRATIGAAEFADRRSRTFDLDPVAAAHLRPLRGALGRLPPRPFSYAP